MNFFIPAVFSKRPKFVDSFLRDFAAASGFIFDFKERECVSDTSDAANKED